MWVCGGGGWVQKWSVNDERSLCFNEQGSWSAYISLLLSFMNEQVSSFSVGPFFYKKALWLRNHGDLVFMLIYTDLPSRIHFILMMRGKKRN